MSSIVVKLDLGTNRIYARVGMDFVGGWLTVHASADNIYWSEGCVRVNLDTNPELYAVLDGDGDWDYDELAALLLPSSPEELSLSFEKLEDDTQPLPVPFIVDVVP